MPLTSTQTSESFASGAVGGTLTLIWPPLTVQESETEGLFIT
ncbi:hypothetical protein OG462_04665 [Streptomyces sp. NBC_01077]|nr:hypothetical protein OG462_04665 [Streptomyces sp. NBC_01077]